MHFPSISGIICCAVVSKNEREVSKHLTPQRIVEAEQFVDTLSRLVSGTKLATNDRNRTSAAAAAALFGIAQDHHHAIVFLLKHTFYSSSTALLRSVFEAYLRGLWLKHCASDADFQKFMNGKPKENRIMIAAIEALPEFGEGAFSSIKTYAWGPMCDFAHTGALHLQRWQSQNGIEQNFDSEEIEKFLNYSELFAVMSGLEVAQMSEDANIVESVFELIVKRWPPQPEV